MWVKPTDNGGFWKKYPFPNSLALPSIPANRLVHRGWAVATVSRWQGEGLCMSFKRLEGACDLWEDPTAEI